MIEGLVAVGIIATVGFLMVRSYNTRRSSESSDSTGGYWPASDMSGPSASNSDRDSGSGSWFSGLFGSSDSSSSSHDSGSSSDTGGSSDSGSSSDGGGGGGGDGGGGGGD